MDGGAVAPAVVGVTVQRARVNGINMRFARSGDRGAEMVLLCHGWPDSWYGWRHQLVALAEAGYFAVAPDMRGFGGTDAPADPAEYDHVECITEDLVQLMRHLGHRTATLVGHDWGAAVVWIAAMKHPELFPRLCAMSVPRMMSGTISLTSLKERFGWDACSGQAEQFFYMLYHNEVDRRTGNLTAAQEYGADPQRFYASLFACSGPPEFIDKHTIPPKVSMVAPRSAGGFLDRLRTLRDPNVFPSWFTKEDLDFYVNEARTYGLAGGLNYYRCLDYTFSSAVPFTGKPVMQPALFLGGERDMVTTMSGGKQTINAMLSESAPNCKVEWLNTGHWIHNENATEVNELLITFLSDSKLAVSKI